MRAFLRRLWRLLAAIRSTNPGFCFLAAGWRRLDDRTVDRGLRAIEVCP